MATAKNPWNPFNYHPSQLAKSFLAFVAPALVSIGAALQDGTRGGSSITTAEWVEAFIAAVVTSVGVFSVSNEPRSAPPEGGYADLLLIAGVVLVVVGLLGLFGVLGLGLALSVVFVVVGLLLVVFGRSA